MGALRLLAMVSLFAAAACSSEDASPSGKRPGGDGTTTGSGGSTTGPSDSGAITPPPDAPIIVVNTDGFAPSEGGNADCTDDSKNFVYVMGLSPTSFASVLYKFAPDKKTFTLVGNINCGGNGDVNSMAVDRQGVAWINWGNQIFRVRTKDASCLPGAPVTLPAGWIKVGMGYSNDAPGSTAETLFLANQAGAIGPQAGTLATLAPSGALTAVSPFMGGNYASLNAELTGTGDARLYSFFIALNNMDPNVDPLFGLVDKATAAVSKVVTLTGISAATAGGATGCSNGGGCINQWAFSFWGGHFYFYTAHGNPSMVTDYDPFAETGNGITLHYAMAPISIVGAGVSTCAPTMPPIVR